MPLHIVPLCNFRYARDICSGATFKYDTTRKIFKAGRPKLLRESTIKEIKKNKGNKLLRSVWNKNIVKNDSKLLCRRNYDISKIIFKCLKVEYRGININLGVSLEEFKNIILNIDRSIELENINDIIINLKRSKNLGDAYGFIKFGVEKSKSLKKFRDKQISGNDFLVHLNRENLLLNLIVNNTYIDKLSEKPMGKDKSIIFTLPYRIRYISKSSERYFDRIYFIETFLYENRFYERCRLRDINKDSYMFIDRITLKDMNYKNITFNLKREALINMFIFCKLMNMDRVAMKNIAINLKTKLLRKDNRKGLSIIANSYGLDRLAVNYIFRDINKLLRRYTEKNIYLGYDIGLDIEVITEINRMKNIYLKDISFINIYGQIEKALLDVTILNIFKSKSYGLGSFNRDLYKNNYNKFIDVIKRWWWLDSTAPKDNLIIPNKDFNYTQELLNNPGYEYLRFNNHPIGWGNSWGIDWNIPAYAVSVEIMLDLVNILIMVWHDNVQGWLCCSGKESMQFVMELINDWYTLDTSKPNVDYYRAYRWIRWEAEKVYFLNLDNGLQAIGVLIANLIDYLKQHHFNVVPLWRNPKAMDRERNFNRIAQNADLMKVLDKSKGKRYYYIETQNIEKKNILGDDINGSNS
jgi:hypothetical protein